MGKDHLGQPSGSNRREGLGLRKDLKPDADSELKKDEEMTDKYTRDDDTLQDNVPMRHPNRNTTKPGETGKHQDSDKGTPYA